MILRVEQPGTALVRRVIDGHTIDVFLDGQTRRVRYFGMDTPERGECFYYEAKEQNELLVEGRTATLVIDVSEADRYGRLLRYVYVGEVFVNADLVRPGYALASLPTHTYPPEVKHSGFFLQLQRQSEQDHWACGLSALMRIPTGQGKQDWRSPSTHRSLVVSLENHHETRARAVVL